VTIAFHITDTTVIVDRVFYGGRNLKPLLGEIMRRRRAV
jgi:pyrimidine operon attenuation protein/uracil phosphoribosyltransferase